MLSVPFGTVYIQVTNPRGTFATPKVYVLYTALLSDPTLLKTGSLSIMPSLNLAKSAYLIVDKHINNAGTVTSAAGWKYLKIPVTAGTTYTFGRFVIDTAGYYSVHDASGAVLFVAILTTGTMPITITIPTGGVFLNIDIARPANTAPQSAQATVNVGATLIDYVDPVDTVTAIAGYKLIGQASDGGVLPENVVVNGANATLADVIADSITTGALIANLPTSSAGLEVGQAYIDAGVVMVKL